uniref:Uncharacterized protein n=1 Tax=Mucochytrium quahogii TaxID=96639 RepID=A0A7S2S7R3_9STRA|mmetsp:Transcript_42840/g.68852  ORF Transcript_42840/g.68852 Transcript_42840/m.68852 type:complete len:451 (-) Transcript_42840:251-1603(-)|eukprot:CAMPEP_0203761434 /NCGR_PEP_ID=MMETSP0098-20131031/14521_1 /ASSEMBLY_ACC=CAM_ASM_000208 /TAXON_ID=96639 /ORGANISM=" , Strain NY0313808BC1" /LENGTH=450 /DNA_ID=CAMNT_0050655431 /DNA_START=49 /DNA_END=1401 /DNA_ORIENTATION=+
MALRVYRATPVAGNLDKDGPVPPTVTFDERQDDGDESDDYSEVDDDQGERSPTEPGHGEGDMLSDDDEEEMIRVQRTAEHTEVEELVEEDGLKRNEDERKDVPVADIYDRLTGADELMNVNGMDLGGTIRRMVTGPRSRSRSSNTTTKRSRRRSKTPSRRNHVDIDNGDYIKPWSADLQLVSLIFFTILVGMVLQGLFTEQNQAVVPSSRVESEASFQMTRNIYVEPSKRPSVTAYIPNKSVDSSKHHTRIENNNNKAIVLVPGTVEKEVTVKKVIKQQQQQQQKVKSINAIGCDCEALSSNGILSSVRNWIADKLRQRYRVKMSSSTVFSVLNESPNECWFVPSGCMGSATLELAECTRPARIDVDISSQKEQKHILFANPERAVIMAQDRVLGLFDKEHSVVTVNQTTLNDCIREIKFQIKAPRSASDELSSIQGVCVTSIKIFADTE